MKIIGKVTEFNISEIYLYGAIYQQIKELINHPATTEVILNEYIPRKRKMKEPPTGTETIFHPDKAKRHQVKIIMNVYVAKIYIYSQAIDHKEVERLGLVPIKHATDKERAVLSIRKMDLTNTSTYANIEHLPTDTPDTSKITVPNIVRCSTY